MIQESDCLSILWPRSILCRLKRTMPVFLDPRNSPRHSEVNHCNGRSCGNQRLGNNYISKMDCGSMSYSSTSVSRGCNAHKSPGGHRPRTNDGPKVLMEVQHLEESTAHSESWLSASEVLSEGAMAAPASLRATRLQQDLWLRTTVCSIHSYLILLLWFIF